MFEDNEKDKEFKQNLKNVLTSFADVFTNERDTNYRPIADAIIAKYHYIDIDDPDKLEGMLALDANSISEIIIEDGIAKLIADNKTTIEKLRKQNEDTYSHLLTIFGHYNFVKRQVQAVFNQFEFGCDCDKSRYLIQKYIDSLLDKEIDELQNEDKRKFWEPKRGSMEQWLDHIHSICQLQGGYNITKYIKTYNVLINEYETEQQKNVNSKIQYLKLRGFSVMQRKAKKQKLLAELTALDAEPDTPDNDTTFKPACDYTKAQILNNIKEQIKEDDEEFAQIITEVKELEEKQ